MATQKCTFTISGMTCGNCEKRIEKAVRRIKGILSVQASFPKKSVAVSYNDQFASADEIKKAIQNEGYAVHTGEQRHSFAKVVPVFLIVLAVYFILKYTAGLDFFNLIPKIDTTVSFIALFSVGLMTSVHCIAMCGGINLSQSVGRDNGGKGNLKKPVLYNLGRVVSYTAVGAVVGGIGSVLFISIPVKGVIMLAAAIFMVLMGLSMLGWLPSWLVPRMPGRILVDANKVKQGKGPFVVGLLNGLLPCGPLQAMQLYALSTGSVLMGAASMFLFSLGTVPLMLGAGVVFSMLKGRFTRGITRVSAVLIILIAVIMFTNAGGLFGWSLGSSQTANAQVLSQSDQASVSTAPSSGGAQQTIQGYQVAQIKDGVQVVTGDLGKSYPNIIVQKGIPVQFDLKADAGRITGCNQTIVVPKFNIQKQLKAGDNVISFTPAESGNIPYTCWMGMVSGQIRVVDDIASVTSKGAVSSAAPSAQPAQTAAINAGGSCCAGAGQATRFANGNIPTDDIQVAKIENGQQVLTVTVNDQGYSPAVLVVQKGIKTLIKFNPQQLSSCNSVVVFPEYNGTVDLGGGQLQTPVLTPAGDFTFECAMGMLHGYVKAVDDINNINLDQIKSEVAQYKPAALSQSCCG